MQNVFDERFFEPSVPHIFKTVGAYPTKNRPKTVNGYTNIIVDSWFKKSSVIYDDRIRR